MRFHIALSKRITLNTIKKLLVLLLVGLLIYFGLLNHAYADTWTNVNVTSASFFTNTNLEYLDYSDDFTNPYDVSPPMYKVSGDKRFYFYSSSTKYRYLPLAMSKGFAQTTSSYWYNTRLTQDFSVDISNNSYCANNTSELKSINIQFSYYVSTTMKHDYESFNQTTVDDLFDIRILSISGENVFPTTCSKVRVDNGVSTLSGEYVIICNNVFQGNTENPVSAFRIQVLNAIPFNDRYLDSTENLGIVIQPEFREHTYDSSSFVLRYSCSEDPPIIDSGPGHGDDDPLGINDIYDKIKEHYDPDISGIPTDGLFIDYPESFSDVIALPVNLLNAISTSGETCTPYSIDLSSLTTSWGGSNYTLTLPCMRSKLSSILGENFYLLLDLLLSAIVFYKIISFIIIYVEALTSGEDLFELFFKGDSSSITNKKE